jgi:hypothetical protein
MLNNQQFTDLERRLWKEGNPLCDELVSTRDTLLALIKEAQGVMEHYKPVLDSLSDAKDLEFYRLWDNFGDTLDNLDYEIGE